MLNQPGARHAAGLNTILAENHEIFAAKIGEQVKRPLELLRETVSREYHLPLTSICLLTTHAHVRAAGQGVKNAVPERSCVDQADAGAVLIKLI